MGPAAIQHACAVKPDGTVWCWGLNNFNQLGNNIFNAINNGTVFGYPVPVEVSQISSTPMPRRTLPEKRALDDLLTD